MRPSLVSWRRTVLVVLSLTVIGGVFAADFSEGRRIYVEVCAACHTNGVAGAPRYGMRKEWESRLQRSRSDLMASVIKGRGAMPPKGGNASVTDAQAIAATEYMLEGMR